MSEQLFNIPETLSPRLAWIKRHGITTEHAEHMKPEEDPWCAYLGEITAAIDLEQIGTGRTEDDALIDLAKLNNWPLWNEEEFKR